MAFTVAQLGNAVKHWRKIPTTNTTFITNDWLYEAIPTALRLMYKEVPNWFTSKDVATVAGTTTYALDAGTVEVLGAYISGYSPMGRMSHKHFQNLVSHDTRGLPSSFLEFYDDPNTANIQPGIAFGPIPDAVYTVKVWVRKTFVTDLTATSDSIDVPHDWRDCLVFFLVSLSYERDEDQAQADRWAAKASDKLRQIKTVEEDKYNQAFLSDMIASRVKIVGGVEYEIG
jgi:hypothetical protein